MVSSEEVVQDRIRLNVALSNVDMWRNNVGVANHVDRYGTVRPVRYGLMNDTDKVNEEFKSSDLIGIRPMLITPEWVGHVVGVFSAIECKESGWKLRPGDKHGQAQKRFIDLVTRAGGFAGFARSVDEARAVLRLGAD